MRAATKPGTTEPSALRKTLGLIRPHTAGSGRLASAGLVALLLEVVARLLEPWPIQWVIDRVIPAVTGRPMEPGITRLLVLAGVAVALVAALRASMSYLSTVAFANVGSQVTTRLRGDVHRRLLIAQPVFHEKVRSGDLVQRVVSDVNRVQEAAVTAGLPLVGNLMTVVAMLGVVMWLDPVLGLVVLAVLPIVALAGRFASRKITTASRTQRKREGDLAGDAGEAFAAIRTVQAFQLADHLGARFSRANVKGLREGVKAKRLSAGLERRTDLVVGIATGVVLTVGGHRVIAGAISPGELVVFITYLKTTFKPLRDLAKHTGRISRAAASGERVADTLAAAEPEADHSWARPLPFTPPDVPIGTFQLDRVTAGYPGGPPVLRDASLTVWPGQRVALVGPSGSGKSTVLLLAMRFLRPRDGVVRLDGHDLQETTLASVRESVSVVLQDGAVFAGSLAENVRLGRLDADDAAVEDALRRACLGELIDAHPDGIHRRVSERGGGLSGGQRQRIVVARALLRDPRIVLLDEPTTGLDAAAAREVLRALMELARGRTTILVTHDPALLHAVDRVVEIVDGRLVERPAQRPAPARDKPRESETVHG